MKVDGGRPLRKAISSVLATVIMFTMLFSAGMGFFIFTNQASLQSLQAGQARQAGVQQAGSERVAMKVGLSASGDLWMRLNNTGSVPVTLVDVFVIDASRDVMASLSSSGNAYLQTSPDLNFSLPLAVPPGYSTSQLKGCGPAAGCDIAISTSAYNYMLTKTPVVVSALTSSGNTFSAPYPPTPTSVTVVSTSVTSTNVTSTSTIGNPGGNVLVVQMTAHPPQTFACTHCVTLNVTVYNYGLQNVTSIVLPDPTISRTGTLSLTYDSSPACALRGGSNKLPGYSGVGLPPHLKYVCYLSANPRGFGGFASFIGFASGVYNGQPITSGVATSNTIQIGGPVNVLNQGPFSANFFYFKYSACTNAPSTSGGLHYSTPCTTTPSPVTVGALNNANSVQGASSYYVAFYIQVTNNFNVTIPILPYSYFQTDATVGSDSAFFVVGSPSSLPSVPNYAPGGTNIPTLTPYPTTCFATSTGSCINVGAGQTVTLTFAACDISSTWWNWAGHAYASRFDSGNDCTTQPPNFQGQVSTYGSTIITFVYKGQVYTQDIPFVGLQVN